jgi:hypothetical protein
MQEEKNPYGENLPPDADTGEETTRDRRQGGPDRDRPTEEVLDEQRRKQALRQDGDGMGWEETPKEDPGQGEFQRPEEPDTHS